MTALAERYCGFRVGGRLYGIDLSLVQEVIGPRPITRLPHAPPMIRGLIQLRGRFLAAIDLAYALSLPPSPAEPMGIVVRSPSGAWAVLVDTVEDIVLVEPSSLEPVPGTVPAQTRGLLHGAFKRERDLLLALDVAQVLRLAEAEEPAAVQGSEPR
jgi:purine-binding chemotaxis protein CheW